MRRWEEEAARRTFEETRLWKNYKTPVPLEVILKDLKGNYQKEFVRWAYHFARALYDKMPRRKNGEEAFVHPTNVARFTAMAGCEGWVRAAALLHDWVEERFDMLVEETGTTELEEQERLLWEVYREFKGHLKEAARALRLPQGMIEDTWKVVWALSRHKKHNYYRSIEQIFNHRDHEIRLAAAMVKLADRMHNILTLENYEDEEQIYQCFKNIYILNKVKMLLLRMRKGKDAATPILEKLFKKCGKATFQALLQITHRIDSKDEIFPLITYLSLALKKYVLEIKGLWRATSAALEPGSPTYSIYHGILEKYDFRLKHDDEAFIRRLSEEIRFLMITYKPLNLPPHLFREAAFYKDSMAFIEVISSLLYLEDYVIHGFRRLGERSQSRTKSD